MIPSKVIPPKNLLSVATVRCMARNKRRQPAGPDPSNDPDQLLLDLVNNLRELDDRITKLERSFEALGESAAGDDEEAVMELRLHTARLSAELSRTTVELRGRIAELAGRSGEELAPTPQLAGDENFEDLTLDSPARAPTRPKTSGWQPAD